MTSRTVVIAIAVVLGVSLLVSSADDALGGGGARDGVRGSSFTTGPAGLAGYADLLAARGHPVIRTRQVLAEAALDPRDTLVVAGIGGVDDTDRAAVDAFVTAGGRLVLLGQDAVGAFGDGRGGAPIWSAGGLTTATPTAAAPEVADVASVQGSGRGAWTQVGDYLPVLGADQRSLVVVATVGSGRVVAVADEDIVQNALLAQHDNATLALDLAGPAGRRVRFAEAIHGYGTASGFAALPRDWTACLLGLLLAAALWLWAGGKRLGPPQQVSRELAPSRAEAVHALAATVVRTREVGPVVARIRRAAQHDLARRSDLAASPDPDAVRAAATAAGLSSAEADALAGGGDDLHAALTAGQALARLEGERP